MEDILQFSDRQQFFAKCFLTGSSSLVESCRMTEPAVEIKHIDSQLLLKAAVAIRSCDQALFELLPEDVAKTLKDLPDTLEMAYSVIDALIADGKRKDQQIQETGLAIAEYANQSGQGQMMMRNLKLCLEQVRKKADARAKLGNQGWG